MAYHFAKNTLFLSISLAIGASTQVFAEDLVQEAAQDKVIQLNTIVVTASGSEVDLKDAPASMSVVTSEDIQRMPVNSLADLLGELPGATGGYSDVGVGSKIAFRGMPSSYTLILIDGKRVGNSSLLGHREDTVSQDLNWISPEMIERIEVVRGSMSTLYGSEAMGGVINIITKKIPDKLSGSLRTDYTQPDGTRRGDTVNVAANIAGPITDSLGFRLGGNFKKRAADEGLINGTGENEKENISGKLDWKLNDVHSLSLDLGYGIEKNPAFSTEEEAILGEHFGADKMEHLNAGIGYQGNFDDALKTNVDLYYNQYDNKSIDFDVDGGTQATETILDLKATKPVVLFNYDHDLTVGAQGKYETVKNATNIGSLPTTGEIPEINKAPEKELDGYAWSLFAEDQIHLDEKFILTLGGRVDGSDDFGTNFSPRVYGVYHPAETWTVKGGVSRSFRAPTLRERSATSGTSSMGMGCNVLYAIGYTGGGCYMLGNPDLKPETSTNYEIGFGYEDAGYGMDFTYFLSDVEDLISTTHFGYYSGMWLTRATNISEARTSGLELTYKFPLGDVLRVTGNATYMLESKNKDTGRALLQTPEFTTNLSVFWDITDRLNAFAKVQYVGEQAIQKADLEAQSRVSSEVYFTNAATTGGIGLNFNYSDNLSFRAGVDNIGGEKINQNNVDYGNPPPATYYAGFTTKF